MGFVFCRRHYTFCSCVGFSLCFDSQLMLDMHGTETLILPPCLLCISYTCMLVNTIDLHSIRLLGESLLEALAARAKLHACLAANICRQDIVKANTRVCFPTQIQKDRLDCHCRPRCVCTDRPKKGSNSHSTGSNSRSTGRQYNSTLIGCINNVSMYIMFIYIYIYEIYM